MTQNQDWENDQRLEHDLKLYVSQNFKRVEILDYMKQDFGDNIWSLRTLARRLQELGKTYINYEISVDDVEEAVEKEFNGPGEVLRYRAMNEKLRTEYSIYVPRHLVHNVMCDVDPEGIAARQLNKKIKKHKQPFTSEGPLWVASLDGHDKLCGYQSSTVPLGVYGCLDTFSRKLLFLFLCFSNSEPEIIGKNFLKYMSKSKLLPYFLRVDRDTETGKMCSIHAFLSGRVFSFDDSLDSLTDGPSTNNKIERFKHDFYHKIEKYFKEQ